MSDTLEQLETEFAEAKEATRELAILERILPLSPRRALELAQKTLELYREIRDRDNIPFALLFVANCHFRLTDYPAALAEVAEAQTYFDKSKNKIGIARCRRLTGEVHLRSGEYAQALEHLIFALELFEDAQEKVRIGATLNSIATVYLKLGSYSVALEYFLRILDEDELKLDPSELAVYLNGIGTTYMHLKDYDKAIEFFQRSLDINRKLNNISGESFVRANLGKSFELLGLLKDALNHQNKALKLQRELGSKYGEALIYTYLGAIYEKLNQYEDSRTNFSLALRLGKQTASDDICAVALGYMGRLAFEEGRFVDAIDLLEQALEYAIKTKQLTQEYMLQKLLFQSWEALGEFEKALKCLEKHAELKEDLFSQDKQRLIAERQANFEVEKARREKEIFRLKAEQAEKEMEFKNKELTVMAMTLVQKNELLAKLKKEVKAIAAKSDEESATVRTKILNQIDQGIDSENDWQMFEQQFKNVHQDFNTVLSQRFPKLTPTELKVCSLIKTGLTSKEIANLLFITYRTVELHRTRIRKKIELPHAANLTSFLASITGETSDDLHPS